MKPRAKIFAVLTVAAALVLGVAWYAGKPTRPKTAVVTAGPVLPRCALQPGMQLAFQLRSRVSAEGQRDDFNAVMSWQVLSVEQGRARVRAALSGVELSQQLSAADQRASSPEGLAFFLEIGPRCGVQSKTFSSSWSANTQLLVSTLLDNFSFSLPANAATQWRSAASDGLGDYQAKFVRVSAAPLKIRRDKLGYKTDSLAEEFGIGFDVSEAQAIATFDTAAPTWWQRIEGSEALSFRSPGSPGVEMAMSFSLQRNNQLFVAVPEVSGLAAAPREPRHSSAALPLNTSHKSYREVRAAFEHALQQHPPRYFDAAVELAAWLQQHPADVSKVVEALHAAQDKNTHPSLFHALELSATAAARQALSALIHDPRLSLEDQALAASALADHGEASQAVADTLLERAQIDDSAGKASLLGLGSLSRRSKSDSLRAYVGEALLDRHGAAQSEADAELLVEAMGNSGDARFVPVLSDALGADSPSQRLTAARALAKLPAEQAAPLLLQHLALEGDERTAAEVAKALGRTGQAPPEATAVVAERLQTAGKQQRAALIEFLGAQNNQASQQLLAQQFKREPSARLKKLIGRYLPAEALR